VVGGDLAAAATRRPAGRRPRARASPARPGSSRPAWLRATRETGAARIELVRRAATQQLWLASPGTRLVSCRLLGHCHAMPWHARRGLNRAKPRQAAVPRAPESRLELKQRQAQRGDARYDAGTRQGEKATLVDRRARHSTDASKRARSVIGRWRRRPAWSSRFSFVPLLLIGSERPASRVDRPAAVVSSMAMAERFEARWLPFRFVLAVVLLVLTTGEPRSQSLAPLFLSYPPSALNASWFHFSSHIHSVSEIDTLTNAIFFSEFD